MLRTYYSINVLQVFGLWCCFHGLCWSTDVSGSQEPRKLRLATYNIWNVMFNWDIRKYRISQMLRDVDADIVAFQEVRASPKDDYTQLDEIQDLVPHLQYKAFQGVSAVIPVKDVYKMPWLSEGVGLLSRYPIVKVEIQNLTVKGSVDMNRRVVLHADIKITPDVSMTVSVVHFTYDRLYQCCNAIDVLGFLKGQTTKYNVVLGDFNAYNDRPDALLMFDKTSQQFSEKQLNKCCRNLDVTKSYNRDLGNFLDVCKIVNKTSNILTFSNMPQPGLTSRPDAILASKNIKSLSCQSTGNGQVYKDYYYAHIIFHRAWLVIATLWDTFVGYTGRPCPYDCGPHASCRCGVCVMGNDKLCCNIPDCEECGHLTLTLLLVFAISGIAGIVFVLYSLLQVLHAMNRKSSRSVLPSCDWFCLLDEVMFTAPPTHFPTTPCRKKSKRRGLFASLPPLVMLLCSLFFLSIYTQMFLVTFSYLLTDIFDVIPEELFPSDHLLLFVDVELA